jgi:lipopolysaccharide biosynthesis glycosyltransferase
MSAAIRIAVTSDENYVLPLAACVRSILDNAHPDGDVEVAVLSCGVSAESRERLLSSWGGDRGRVRFLDVDLAALADLPTTSRVSKHLTASTYARLLMPDMLPQDWQRVLFLDTDTVTMGSLVDLWATPLGHHPFAATRDPYTPVLSSDHGVPGWRRLGLDPNAPYFNAGMLLIDLANWRRQKISARAFDYILENRDEIQLADQEALNVVVAGDFPIVDPIWNVMNYWFDAEYEPEVLAAGRLDVRERVRLRHYNGPWKPWTDTGYYAVRDIDITPFFHHLDRTEWRGRRPGGR